MRSRYERDHPDAVEIATDVACLSAWNWDYRSCREAPLSWKHDVLTGASIRSEIIERDLESESPTDTSSREDQTVLVDAYLLQQREKLAQELASE